MYYYIFEPSLEAKEYERIAKIKEYLSTIGIAGEMVSPTPGRTTQDLVDLAVAKRYSTIVAVGGSSLINRIARAIEPHDIVLGLIPLRESTDLAELIGASDWKEAADSLKRRRWQPVRLGLINDELCFITPATIKIPDAMPFRIGTPTFEMDSEGGTLSIAPSFTSDGQDVLDVRITHGQRKGGFLENLLGKTSPGNRDSHIIVTELEFHATEPIPVVVAGMEICSTPIHCAPQEKPVKLIIGKGNRVLAENA